MRPYAIFLLLTLCFQSLPRSNSSVPPTRLDLQIASIVGKSADGKINTTRSESYKPVDFHITGVVTDIYGATVAGAKIYLTNTKKINVNDTEQPSAITKEDGKFDVQVPGAGLYRVVTITKDLETATEEAEVTEEHPTVFLSLMASGGTPPPGRRGAGAETGGSRMPRQPARGRGRQRPETAPSFDYAEEEIITYYDLDKLLADRAKRRQQLWAIIPITGQRSLFVFENMSTDSGIIFYIQQEAKPLNTKRWREITSRFQDKKFVGAQLLGSGVTLLVFYEE